MNTIIDDYITENANLLYQTLKELCHIPAPSHYEHKRAEYCKLWLERFGAEGVYIDDAQNVIFPINCDDSNEITVFAAHTDTVFPDLEPMPYYDDGQKIFSPGVADDTASVAILLLTSKFFADTKAIPSKGIMFVLNSAEEGLGNLKGVRKLFEDYARRISAFVTLDSTLNLVIDRAVGSHRYEVSVSTEGGHSYNKFGNQNAIAEISHIISEIYKIQLPTKEGTKTTYNVGLIEGGTSVNTIAQSAKMLCEYRSDDKECLEYMEQQFQTIFKNAAKRVSIEVTMVGDRPCSDIAPDKIEDLKNKLVPIIEESIDQKVAFVSGSTDCNIPLSIGVAALCIGTDIHDKTHTREEWVDKDSLKTGLSIALKTSLKLSNPKK